MGVPLKIDSTSFLVLIEVCGIVMEWITSGVASVCAARGGR